MNELLEYFRELNEEDYYDQRIKVFGSKSYKYHLVGSVLPYLFEDLNLKEHIAKPSNENRPGNKKVKKYICIHDTGDIEEKHTAKYWSDAVYKEALPDTKQPYACSFQYVVGNDGVYHNIPDDEVAWHAGDSTKVDYNLIDTGVEGTDDDYGNVTISSDGYYEIDGKKTIVLAPKFEKGDVSKLCTTEDINDQGIRVELIDSKWYIGETYFNPTYEKIANRGGNNNSIGIEMCVNKGCNLMYNYQQTAKLVVKLLKENNLTMDDIKQHHFYSGKNCPQTLRTAGFWDYFFHLIEVEAIVDQFIEEGYKIKFVSECAYVKDNGTIDRLPASVKGIPYRIEVEKDGVVEAGEFVRLL